MAVTFKNERFKKPNIHVENDSDSDEPDIEETDDESLDEQEKEHSTDEDDQADESEEDNKDGAEDQHEEEDEKQSETIDKDGAFSGEEFEEKSSPNDNEESEEEIDEINMTERLSGSDADSEASDCDKYNSLDINEESGMASVMARILSKEISSGRVLLAKGKTDREVLNDIAERKRRREAIESEGKDEPESKSQKETHEMYKEEKRKIWESMARKEPSVLDIPKETRLRKIATQGMVQLFQSVHQHQKIMNQKLSSVGASERKRDMVMQEFSKGKFLDMLKPKDNSKANQKSKQETEHKWKILQDDYMMTAHMKDWDKEDNDCESEQSMDEDDMSGSGND